MKIKIFLTTAVTMTCLMFMSCSQDDYDYDIFDTSNGNSEILKSKEFDEYVTAYFDFQKVTSIYKALDSTDCTKEKIYFEKKSQLDSKYKAFLNKFPNYEPLKMSVKIDLIQKVATKRNLLKRTKDYTNEASWALAEYNSGFTGCEFSFWVDYPDEAYFFCKDYMAENDLESAAYVFKDFSAIVYTKEPKTWVDLHHVPMLLIHEMKFIHPFPNAYGAEALLGYYHMHPEGSPLSGVDYTTETSFRSYYGNNPYFDIWQ